MYARAQHSTLNFKILCSYSYNLFTYFGTLSLISVIQFSGGYWRTKFKPVNFLLYDLKKKCRILIVEWMSTLCPWIWEDSECIADVKLLPSLWKFDFRDMIPTSWTLEICWLFLQGYQIHPLQLYMRNLQCSKFRTLEIKVSGN